jgi:hypothetical protein
MRWIVVAGSNFTDYEAFRSRLSVTLKHYDSLIVIAGTQAERLARKYSLETRTKIAIATGVKNALGFHRGDGCIQFEGGKTSRRIARKIKQNGLPVVEMLDI